MSAEDAAIQHDLEKLRRDGGGQVWTLPREANAWQAALRRACRTARLRVPADADDWITWAWHVDHMMTESEDRAARRTVDRLTRVGDSRSGATFDW
jgi:hypothetical protein